MLHYIQRGISSVAAVGFPSAATYWSGRIAAKLGMGQGSMVTIQPRGIAHPIQLRGGPSSDLQVFRQIFLDQEYQPLVGGGERIGSVLDLGANIGLASIYFLNRFPDATILAVEPNPDNAEMCRRNLRPYGKRARVLEGAVWVHEGELALSRDGFGDGREWASSVVEIPETGTAEKVKCWTMPQLLDALGTGGRADLVKIDIEGAEEPLFRADAGVWLGKVRNLCIELHGKACRDAFDEGMRHFEREQQYSGELLVCRGIRERVEV